MRRRSEIGIGTWGAAVLLFVAALDGRSAWGTMTRGDIEAQLSYSLQSTMQHNGVDHPEWVQERNEVNGLFTYHFLKSHSLFGTARVPFLEDGIFHLQYRARFDPVYLIRDHYDDIYSTHPQHDFAVPDEYEQPREMFLDLDFGDVGPGHLSSRIGKQQIVWGEADLFRSIDVFNTFRLDQNFFLGERFDDFRVPTFATKFLYDIGQVGPVANVGLEAAWSPDSKPLTDHAIVEEILRLPFDPERRSNHLPYRLVRNPWSFIRVGPGKTDAPDRGVFPKGAFGGATGDFIYLVQDRYPGTGFDNNEVGVRLLGKYGAADFTLNYLYKRTEIPGGGVEWQELFFPDGNPKLNAPSIGHTFASCLAGRPTFVVGKSIRGYANSIGTGCTHIFLWYPWTHIIGGTVTYNDFKYTGLIWRLEQSVSTKEPRNRALPLVGDRAGQLPNAQDFATKSTDHTLVWRSMVGFDLLRAFPWLPTRHDQWLVSMQLLTEYNERTKNQIGQLFDVHERMHHWNNTATFLATGFFLNSRFRPIIAGAYEFNSRFPVLWLQGEWYVNPRLSIRAGEILYMGSRFASNPLFLNKFADRDETYIRLIYWLL